MRPLLAAAFGFLLAYAQWEELGPPLHSAKLKLVTRGHMPARIYVSRNKAPFRLAPVDAVIPIRSDLYYRDAIYTRNANPKTFEVVANDEYHYLLTAGEGLFYVPPGSYKVEAYRGLLYKPGEVEFELKADESREVTIDLVPWTDPAQWVSGDDHIHLTRDRKHDPLFLSWLAAEDLTVGNFLQLQRQMDAAVQYGFGRAAQPHRERYTIRSGHESRNEFWGHTNVLGPERLTRPMSTGTMYANSAPSDPFPYWIFAEGRKVGGLAGFAHFFEKPQHSTIYMQAALGDLDFVEVFQFGVLKRDSWYEMLNAGLRVNPIAGSDFPVPLSRMKPWPRWIPLLGPERAMVKARPGEDAWDTWSRGVKEGRAMVTNGPLVELDFDAKTGRVVARASFWRKLARVEIVRNGEVIASGTGPEVAAPGIDPLESCWLAARAESERREGEPVIQGHTYPVYVIRNGKPVNAGGARARVRAKWEEELRYLRGAGIQFSSEERKREFESLAEKALANLR
ncbi:MAG: CehA/McbA family metallohydrolase [Bryobacteraceae bacterium]